MKNTSSQMMSFIENIPRFSRKNKYLVLLITVLFTVFFYFGFSKIQFVSTIENWFADDDPMLVSLNEFRAEFGSDDHTLIIYKPKDKDVFSERSLELISNIRKDLIEIKSQDPENSPLKRVVRITSPVNAPVLSAQGGALVTQHLVGEDIPDSATELSEIRELAFTKEELVLRYFSENSEYGGLLIETDFGAIPINTDQGELAIDVDSFSMDNATIDAEDIQFAETDMSEYVPFIEAINSVLNKPEYIDHFEFHGIGNAAATEYDLKIVNEMGLLYLGTILVMVLVLGILFRSVSGVLWPLSIVILSSIWSIGFAGWAGLQLTGYLILSITMILAIGIADSVHVLSGFLQSRSKGLEHTEAVDMAYKRSSKGILLSTVTTMIAMLVLSFTPLIPIRDFGYMTTIGIGLAYLFTLFLLPVLLDLWPPVKKKPKKKSSMNKLVPRIATYLPNKLEKLIPFVTRNATSIVAVFAVLFLSCIFGASKIVIDTNPVAQYPDDFKIIESFEIADEEMMGAQTMEIFLDMGVEYAFHDPDVIQKMDDIQVLLETKYKEWVVKTLSLVHIVKDSNQMLNDNDEAFYATPKTSDLLSQNLFIFNNSNPVDRRKIVSDDYQRAHITVSMRNAGSYEYTKIYSAIQEDIERTMQSLRAEYPNMRITVTGFFALMMQGADHLSWSAINSFGIVMLAISVLLLLALGSIKAGLLSIVPNLLPATLAVGIMGYLGLPIDFFTMIIAPIIIGIAVDDTIHFLAFYRNEMREHNDIQLALTNTVRHVGQAVIFTTLIIGLGLGVLAFSSSVGTAYVGIFGALSMLVALLCDLLLLPALMVMFDVRFEEEAIQQETVVFD